jgi:hypothetical protein
VNVQNRHIAGGDEMKVSEMGGESSDGLKHGCNKG